MGWGKDAAADAASDFNNASVFCSNWDGLCCSTLTLVVVSAGRSRPSPGTPDHYTANVASFSSACFTLSHYLHYDVICVSILLALQQRPQSENTEPPIVQHPRLLIAVLTVIQACLHTINFQTLKWEEPLSVCAKSCEIWAEIDRKSRQTPRIYIHVQTCQKFQQRRQDKHVIWTKLWRTFPVNFQLIM